MKTRLKIYKMATSILLKFLTLKWNISRTIWRIEVGDGSFLCIFHALSCELNSAFDRRFPLTCCVREMSTGSISLASFSPIEAKFSLSSSASSSFPVTFQSFTFSISMSDPLLSSLMACFKIFHVPFMFPLFLSL